MSKAMRKVFYIISVLTTLFWFIPLFCIDLRATPSQEHVYVYRSLFTLGLSGTNNSGWWFAIVHYLPLAIILIIMIPLINRRLFLTNVFLAFSIIVCLFEAIRLGNKLAFGVLLIFMVAITSIYNIQYFLHKNKIDHEKICFGKANGIQK